MKGLSNQGTFNLVLTMLARTQMAALKKLYAYGMRYYDMYWIISDKSFVFQTKFSRQTKLGQNHHQTIRGMGTTDMFTNKQP